MIALVYASLLIFSVVASTITPFGWLVLGCLALLIFAYLMFAEWELARATFR